MQGCTREAHDYLERDGAVLENALCNYAVDYGWDGLVHLCGAIEGRRPDANRALLRALSGGPSAGGTAECNPTGVRYIARSEVRLDSAGAMLDHWSRPYRIALCRDLDERGQATAVKLTVSSSGRNGIEDHGRGDGQIWSTVMHW
jgi:hypothetical protein